jgi:putative salt-induced outer membrane protein
MAHFLKTAIIIAAVTTANLTAYASDGTSKDGWKGDIELNALFASGNTKQTTFGFAGKVTRTDAEFHHTISAFYDVNKSGLINFVKDRERYGAAYKLDFDLDDRSFVTAGTAYEHNAFGAFYERIIANVAYGYKVLASDDMHWALEAGPAVLWVKHDSHHGYNSNLTAFIGSHFDMKITDTTDFSNKTEFFWGKSLTIENKTAIKFKISDKLRSKFSFDLMYDEDAAHGRQNTDTIFRIGLVYDF